MSGPGGGWVRLLNLERLGNITAELSSSLIQSIMLPGQWLGRLHWGASRNRTVPSDRAEDLDRDYLPTGLVVLTGTCPIPEDAVVATIRYMGSRNLRVAVIPLSAHDAEQCGAESWRVFVRYGISQIDVVNLHDRADADAAATVQRLEDAQVIFMYGEDGLRARDLLLGTAVHGALSLALRKGKVLIGAGGGGALLAERMVAPDPQGDGTVVERGLGLLPRLMVPTGLDARQGYNRLLHTMGGQLGVQFLGICTEPGGGVSIKGGEAWVLGDGSVTFLDGRESSLAADGAPDPGRGDALAPADSPPVCGLRVHVLVADYGLHLRTRRPLAPTLRPAARPAANG